MDKRGDYKYGILISFIIGILVLGVVLYFIYGEYFSQEEVDWEVCRQSILLRDGNVNNLGKSFQEAMFPIKCKTQVINIDFKDSEKAMKLIADTAATCWSVYGEGSANLFPSRLDLGREVQQNYFVCARVHFDEEVKDFYEDFDNDNVGVRPLDYFLKMQVPSGGVSYYDYIYSNLGENSNSIDFLYLILEEKFIHLIELLIIIFLRVIKKIIILLL
jgi:hypothetical protein